MCTRLNVDMSVVKEILDNAGSAKVTTDSLKQTEITDVEAIMKILLPGFRTLFNKTTFCPSMLSQLACS